MVETDNNDDTVSLGGDPQVGEVKGLVREVIRKEVGVLGVEVGVLGVLPMLHWLIPAGAYTPFVSSPLTLNPHPQP